MIFAQRLPALVAQLGVAGPQAPLEEKLILQVEALLAFVINPDHRLMVINNVGKSGGAEKTLKYVLRLRGERVADQNQFVNEFVRHLIPPAPEPTPSSQASAVVLRLLRPEAQRWVVKAIMNYDRIPKANAEALGKALAAELGLTGLETEIPGLNAPSPKKERELAWEKIKDLIVKRTDAAAVASVIRDRLHAKYDVG